MAIKNKYQRQKQQYSNDGGQTWFDVVPANYRKGSLIEEASEDCNTTQWVEVQNAWYCIGDSVDIQYRWVDIEQTMCNGYDKYSMQKQQQSTDGGVTWTDTGNTRQGDVIELNSEDCGYVVNKRWVTVEGEYICNGHNKYVKEKEQQSTDGGVTWTDTGNTRQGTLIESDSEDCGYKPGYETQYLTMEALDNATIEVYPQYPEYTTSYLYYKRDNEEWKKIDTSNYNLIEITLDTSSKIMIRETLRVRKATRFKCSSGHINVYGNIMSLVYGDDFIGKTTMSGFSLESVFSESNIIDAGNLILPATTLSKDCYNLMFDGCTSLTTAPALPATTLAEDCYNSMFYGCTSLTQAPELPATTLERDCYHLMFKGCTSLTQAPVLPATELADFCYKGMFDGCTSLTTAPELPATTLKQYCYSSMFYGCTSLTQAPVLPATELDGFCYYSMFEGCTSLNNINCQLTNLDNTATREWVTGVQTNSGTFTYNCLNGDWTTGVNGIPENWTRQCE